MTRPPQPVDATTPHAPRRPQVRVLRLLWALVGALVLVVVTAAPAAADPAGPSDFRSEVTGIEPANDAVHATIRGGDSFLDLRVERGHRVTVLGYSGEPYLQVLEDGTVQRNRLSSATYLNDDRTAQVEIPAHVRAAMEDGAEPDWETVDRDGSYAWHDHRVHWMSTVDPPVERGSRVPGAYDPWRVPITVDGVDAEVLGTLTFASQTSPLPWAALALLAGAAVALAGRRGRSALRLAALAMAPVAATAIVVGQADWSATPEGGGNPLLVALAVAAAVLAIAAALLARRSAGLALALGAVASLSGWALLRVQVLLKPVLPTELPWALDRATVALAFGTAAAAAYLAVASTGPAAPEPDQ